MGFRRRPRGVIAPILSVLFLLGACACSTAQTSSVEPRLSPVVETKPTPSPAIRIDLDRVREKIESGAKPRLPEIKRPATLLIGDFSLAVESYSNNGTQDVATKRITGASGTAWVRFSCGGPYVIPGWLGSRTATLATGLKRSFHTFDIVDRVMEPAKQISVSEAQLIQPDAKSGQKMELELVLESEDTRSIVSARNAIIEGLKLKSGKGDALVRFENVTIEEVAGKEDTGRITQGSAVFPADPAKPSTFTLSIEGFTAVVSALTLTPTGATAQVTLRLPSGIGAADTCLRPSLSLGTVAITPSCEFYTDKLSDAYGPWIVGDTGLVVSGTGYTADFSSTQSPGGEPASFKGLVLSGGTASGASTNPSQSNIGYLAADYSFPSAQVTKGGFKGQLTSKGAVEFQTVNPANFTVRTEVASLVITDSRISQGQFGTGSVTLPTSAVCKEKRPGSAIQCSFTAMAIQDDLDLSGEVSFGDVRLGWGELTHVGEEVPAWGLKVDAGYFYIPGGPVATFSPDTGTGFMSWSLGTSPPAALSDMESGKITGVAIPGQKMDELAIYSPDRPGGTANPIRFRYADGWLRIGHLGIDAHIRGRPSQWNVSEPLGNKTRVGYVGNEPFDSVLGIPQKESGVEFKFATSSAYDSDIDGKINLKMPCNITGLEFADMKTSSTANLVGGNVVLPTGGVTLDYWKLGFVPTGDPNQAGVVSVRTGRLVFTAAGISEPVHFLKAFRLTWGEMLADGNLGELFFDYNSYGQRFDKLKYSPSQVALSKYVPGATNGYLATCGSVYFNYFGSAFVNIRDARNDAQAGAPYYGRDVTVPKAGETGWKETNLHLHGDWNDVTGKALASLDFPDATMDYNTKTQWGFIGTGTGGVDFVHSDGLNATIEIHDDAIDICLTSTTTHDLDLGFWAALGGISHISGCIRITGPTLERLVLGGYLEQSVSTGTGIVEPKAGYVVEVVASVTPTTCSFYMAGDMLLQCAGAAVDVSGTVFLKHDFSKHSAEGDVTARLNCNSFLGGLEGNGQVTWYVDSSIQYLQGRLAMTIAGWSGGAGMEGGMFIGHNCPKAKAWVLQTTTGKFGISQNQLPDTLTGVYGYGQVSFGVNWYVFGGGVELYAGLGAFSIVPPGMNTAWSDLTGIGLPYVLGSAGVCVHGEILGGLVSASGWCNLTMGGPVPITFEGRFGLEGCVLWVLCASVEVTAGLGPGGFYLE
ncbi:MAG: hypothetical protein ACP5R5_11000 [Armatimonadota bacterium]